MMCCFFFFFFKQKTAYEMRISDWSSDVCSSDLSFGATDPVALHGLDRLRPVLQRVQAIEQFLRVIGDLEEPLRNLALLHQRTRTPATAFDHLLVGEHGLIVRIPVDLRLLAVTQRSDDSRCGIEVVSTCRS